MLWDQSRAKELFGALNNGTHVPKSLLTGSKLTGTG